MMVLPAPMTASYPQSPGMLKPNGGGGVFASAHTLLAAGCALLLCVGGCSSQSRGSKIIVSDGCMIYIETVSSESSQDISKQWELYEDCKLKNTTDMER